MFNNNFVFFFCLSCQILFLTRNAFFLSFFKLFLFQECTKQYKALTKREYAVASILKGPFQTKSTCVFFDPFLLSLTRSIPTSLFPIPIRLRIITTTSIPFCNQKPFISIWQKLIRKQMTMKDDRKIIKNKNEVPMCMCAHEMDRTMLRGQ